MYTCGSVLMAIATARGVDESCSRTEFIGDVRTDRRRWAERRIHVQSTAGRTRGLGGWALKGDDPNTAKPPRKGLGPRSHAKPRSAILRQCGGEESRESSAESPGDRMFACRRMVGRSRRADVQRVSELARVRRGPASTPAGNILPRARRSPLAVRTDSR